MSTADIARIRTLATELLELVRKLEGEPVEAPAPQAPTELAPVVVDQPVLVPEVVDEHAFFHRAVETKDEDRPTRETIV